MRPCVPPRHATGHSARLHRGATLSSLQPSPTVRIVALAALFAATPGPLLAAPSIGPVEIEITLHPVRDTAIFAEGALSNGVGSHLFAGVNGGGYPRRSFLGFDVASSIPAGAAVQSATLQLFLSKTATDDEPVSLHRMLAAWDEGTSNSDFSGAGGGQGAPATPGDCTWLKRDFPDIAWTTPGGDFVAASSATIPVIGNDFYVWGPTPALSSDVQLWIDTPGADHGWALVGDESGPFTAKRFASRESFNPLFWPQLTVVYTLPPPCPADLDGSGSVDGADLSMLLGAWGDAAPDLNGDGVVDGADLGVLLGGWGDC